ncbi:hypothetical protein [Streptomyces flaveolus]|uniref:hypothetical protein n=1 Tax=Streptomyces flaveolus TaxID=67297 RepID=UPI0033F580A0
MTDQTDGYIRLQVVESLAFQAVRAQRATSSFPFVDALRHAKMPLVIGILRQAATGRT